MDNSGDGKFILSADISGSHITAAVIDVERKAVLKETQVRAGVDSKGTAPEILNAWTGTLNYVLRNSNLPVNKPALDMPGPFDYSNGKGYLAYCFQKCREALCRYVSSEDYDSFEVEI